MHLLSRLLLHLLLHLRLHLLMPPFPSFPCAGAFVCHQTAEEIKASRDMLRTYHGRGLPADKKGPLPKGAASPFRDRSVEDNLKHFLMMKQGRYDEGAAFLRIKGDLVSENSSMWDLAAYRIMFHEHPKTGDAWCIYPTYDYTHCIVDSLENITHSLCTLEFSMRQAVDGPYYHLLHNLKLYKPVTWEYSRLNLTHTVMSKRKLKFLVNYEYAPHSTPRSPRLPLLCSPPTSSPPTSSPPTSSPPIPRLPRSHHALTTLSQLFALPSRLLSSSSGAQVRQRLGRPQAPNPQWPPPPRLFGCRAQSVLPRHWSDALGVASLRQTTHRDFFAASVLAKLP